MSKEKELKEKSEKKEIAEFRDLPRQLVAHDVSCSKHDRRGLTGNAGDAEDGRSEDAR